MLPACAMLSKAGYKIYATHGTYSYLTENGIEVLRALTPSECEDPSLVNNFPSSLDLIHNQKVEMVINIPKDYTHKELGNGYRIRRAAVDSNVPLFTNARLATAFIKAFCTLTLDDLKIKSWDEYVAGNR